MIWFLVVAVTSYFIGSLPSGYIAGKLAGVDIRTLGSGNIGATNVTRSLGKKYGYPVFIADFGKGLVAVFLASRLAEQPGAVGHKEIYQIVAAVCCVLGNTFPVWLGFKGGKGVAVSAGLMFALMPVAGLIAILVWLALFYLTGYVSLASIIATIALPITVFVLLKFNQMTEWSFLYVSIVLTGLIIFRHRSNISQLIHGTEHRFRRDGH
ncbi:MAG TPA: glycerol-3-phosphate 1-O-acyltransferase PlsY [Chthoniobacterales bacterium]|nr:glycerol-3-phosphate 1-O-acyltransferase PlsY [Chthoniobacterales bacterium]